MKQTAVEFLQECLSNHLSHNQQMQFEGLFQQAKEMEKQHMIDFAFNFYYDFCNKTNVPFNLISENKTNAEHYYNESFNTKER